MTLRQRILKDTILYTIANYAAMAIGIIVSLTCKSLLGAVGAGYWALLKVFQSYGEYTDLGTRDALMREVPQAAGAEDHVRSLRIQTSAFAFTMSMALLSAAAMGIFAFFWISDPVLKKGAYLTALLLLATHHYNFFLTLLRTLKKVKALSVMILANMIFAGICMVVGAKAGGVLGLAAGAATATAVAAVTAYALMGVRLMPQWNSVQIFELVKIGLPMAALSYTLIMFLNIDAMMIGGMLGIQQLGFYTIALMSVQQISTLGRFVQIIIFPHIQERYGRTGSLQESAGFFIKTTEALQFLLPAVIGLCFFAIPCIVEIWLPKFIPGIGAMRILVAFYYFVAVNEMSSSILYTINRQALLIPVYLLTIVFAAGSNYCVITAGYGIRGVAAATGASYLVFFVLVFIMSFHRLVGWQKALLHVLGIVVVFVYFSAALIGVDHWVVCVDPILRFGLQVAAYAIAIAPLLWFYERRAGLFPILAGVVADKIGRKKLV